jgi:hypothetical protein
LEQIAARRADRADKKRDRHGIQQDHTIEDRRIRRRKVVAPCRHETEQQGHDDWSQRAQNGIYQGTIFENAMARSPRNAEFQTADYALLISMDRSVAGVSQLQGDLDRRQSAKTCAARSL